MSRYLNNLEMLCNKLQQRYGQDDSLYLEVKADLDAENSHSAMPATDHDWSVSYQTLIMQQRTGTLAQHCR
ncbi:MAG: hypothetical protein ACOYNF_10485 [Rhodoferax sp.]